MPISLYNGQAFVLENMEDLDRSQLMVFFLNGHREDIIVLQDKNGEYTGCISYGSLLFCSDIEGAVIHERIFVGNHMWEKAQNLINDNSFLRLPIFNDKMEMLYLVKSDYSLSEVWQMLKELKSYVNKNLISSFEHYKQHIHLRGMNQVLWEFRKWLLLMDIEVSVSGEAWELFGIKNIPCTDKNITIVGENYDWLKLIYLDYWNWLEKATVNMKRMLAKTYIQKNRNQEKIMFYMPAYACLVDSVVPLVIQYLEKGKECIVVFHSVEGIMKIGVGNVRKITDIISKLESAGAKCYSGDNNQLFDNEYKVCFFCSEYSLGGGTSPVLANLRRLSKKLVSLQTTAIYSHMYNMKSTFETVFSNHVRKEIDYLVAAEHTADWVSEYDKSWDKKILRFGYPKLDKLYHVLKSEMEFPEDWIRKTADKKIVLFTTKFMRRSWLDFLSSRKNIAVIWRPHPLMLQHAQQRAAIERISRKYNIIVDDMLSYYAAYKISDAQISQSLTSAAVNYLYMQKPNCIYENTILQKKYKNTWIDYREELWYKSSYIATKDEEVFEFIKMVERSCDFKQHKLEEHRNRMLKNFDGKVCSRIYDFFENLVD